MAKLLTILLSLTFLAAAATANTAKPLTQAQRLELRRSYEQLNTANYTEKMQELAEQIAKFGDDELAEVVLELSAPEHKALTLKKLRAEVEKTSQNGLWFTPVLLFPCLKRAASKTATSKPSKSFCYLTWALTAVFAYDGENASNL